MSEPHKNLAEALLAFKAEAPALPKDKVNPHFKSRYTGLDTIADKIDPLLVKHGLVWLALPGHDSGHPTLEYELIHAASGETKSGSMLLMLDKENSQGLGSALTYSRRYAKTTVLDLVTDEDDDGNGASRPRQQPQRPAVDFRAAATGLKGSQIREAFIQCGLQPPGSEVPTWQLFDNVPPDKAPVLAEALRSIER